MVVRPVAGGDDIVPASTCARIGGRTAIYILGPTR
jgi:hypothetical protein